MSNNAERTGTAAKDEDDDEPDEWCGQLMGFLCGEVAADGLQGQENLQYRLRRCVLYSESVEI